MSEQDTGRQTAEDAPKVPGLEHIPGAQPTAPGEQAPPQSPPEEAPPNQVAPPPPDEG